MAPTAATAAAPNEAGAAAQAHTEAAVAAPTPAHHQHEQLPAQVPAHLGVPPSLWTSCRFGAGCTRRHTNCPRNHEAGDIALMHDFLQLNSGAKQKLWSNKGKWNNEQIHQSIQEKLAQQLARIQREVNNPTPPPESIDSNNKNAKDYVYVQQATLTAVKNITTILHSAPPSTPDPNPTAPGVPTTTGTTLTQSELPGVRLDREEISLLISSYFVTPISITDWAEILLNPAYIDLLEALLAYKNLQIVLKTTRTVQYQSLLVFLLLQHRNNNDRNTTTIQDLHLSNEPPTYSTICNFIATHAQGITSFDTTSAVFGTNGTTAQFQSLTVSTAKIRLRTNPFVRLTYQPRQFTFQTVTSSTIHFNYHSTHNAWTMELLAELSTVDQKTTIRVRLYTHVNGNSNLYISITAQDNTTTTPLLNMVSIIDELHRAEIYEGEEGMCRTLLNDVYEAEEHKHILNKADITAEVWAAIVANATANQLVQDSGLYDCFYQAPRHNLDGILAYPSETCREGTYDRQGTPTTTVMSSPTPSPPPPPLPQPLPPPQPPPSQYQLQHPQQLPHRPPVQHQQHQPPQTPTYDDNPLHYTHASGSIFFRGNQHLFSNLHPLLNGRTIPSAGGAAYTAEHAFQCDKFRNNPARIQRIMQYEERLNGYYAKRTGRVHASDNFDTPSWRARNTTVMLNILRAKFEPTSPEALELMATGTKFLAEDTDDRFWAYAHGAGKNTLGNLLMLIRYELINDFC